MPAPPAALLVAPERPAPPENGTVQKLLQNAAEFGGYVSELENQNAAWRTWASPHSNPPPVAGKGAQEHQP